MAKSHIRRALADRASAPRRLIAALWAALFFLATSTSTPSLDLGPRDHGAQLTQASSAHMIVRRSEGVLFNLALRAEGVSGAAESHDGPDGLALSWSARRPPGSHFVWPRPPSTSSAPLRRMHAFRARAPPRL